MRRAIGSGSGATATGLRSRPPERARCAPWTAAERSRRTYHKGFLRAYGPARARVKIVAPGPNPLAGVWSQMQTPSCVGPGGPVRELILRRSGGLQLTVRPFETWVDIVGTYTFDPATTLLELRSSTRAMDGGLFLAGYARVGEDGSLEITLADGGDRVGLFATMPGEERCRAVFRRSGDAP
mgnify:CR=1 FL=1